MLIKATGEERPRRKRTFWWRDGRLLQWSATACCLATILLMSGCVTTSPLDWIRNGFKVGPNYCPPPAPVAEGWIQANDSRVQNRHLQDWWEVFNDSTLNALINTAYEQNLNLRTAAARVLEARATASISVGNIFPQTQQATGAYSRIGLSHTAFNNPAAISSALANMPGAMPFPPGTPFGNFYSDWSTGFNLSWELDFWGRLRRQIESSNASLDATVEDYDNAMVTLFADVATNYVNYRVAQQRIKIARENVKIQQGALELVEQKFKAGLKATELDVQQAKTILEQTRSTIPVLQSTMGQANDTLCILLGIPPRDLEPELGPGPEITAEPLPTVPKWAAVGIPADLLRRRPDIRSAERQVAAQSAQIGVAEAALYPTILINGTLGWEAPTLSQLFESQSFFGSITPKFQWNILNYGRIANNVHLQQAKTQELIFTYQNLVLTAAQEVQTNLRSFLLTQEQVGSLGLSVKAAVKASEIGLLQYKAGTIPFNTVFNLETSQVQQQDLLAIAQGTQALNLINVYRYLGGGWEYRLQRENGGCPGTGPGPAACAEAPAASAPVPVTSAKGE
jgi:NodT family efflux transporter outer membrane factor (OMF) lipoprotein